MGYLEYAKGVAQAAYAWSSEGVVYACMGTHRIWLDENRHSILAFPR
jgi:hypothetical protein